MNQMNNARAIPQGYYCDAIYYEQPLKYAKRIKIVERNEFVCFAKITKEGEKIKLESIEEVEDIVVVRQNLDNSND